MPMNVLITEPHHCCIYIILDQAMQARLGRIVMLGNHAALAKPQLFYVFGLTLMHGNALDSSNAWTNQLQLAGEADRQLCLSQVV